MIKRLFRHITLLCLVMLVSCEGSSDINSVILRGTVSQLNASLDATIENKNDLATGENYPQLKAAVYMRLSTTDEWKYKHVLYSIASDGRMTTEQTPIMLPGNGDNVEFVAYLPSLENVSSIDDPVFVVEDWSNQELIKQEKDLMTATAVGINKQNPETNLEFYHAFSKIVFNISPAETSNISLEGLKASISGINCPLSYHVLTKEIEFADQVLDEEIMLTMIEGNGSKIGAAIVPPNMESGETDRIVTFSLPSGRVYTWTIPSSIKFEPNNSYVWNAVVSDKEVIVDSECPDILSGDFLNPAVLPETLELNPSNVTVYEEDVFQIMATIMPESATNKELSWTSSDPSIATVDSHGTVRAISQGDAFITAETTDGQGISDYTHVTVIHPYINGHKYVDLGLPSGLLWATMNVGADSAEKYGDFYSWGEIVTKDDYDWPAYSFCNGTIDRMTKYVTSADFGTIDNKSILDSQDDVASVEWRGSWRMPTFEEQNELLEYCSFSATTLNGIKGYTAQGPSGRSLFLPLSGSRGGTKYFEEGSHVLLWSKNLNIEENHRGYALIYPSDFESDNFRAYGRPVRPVSLEKYSKALSVSTQNATIKVGEKKTLKATVSPTDTDNKLVLWTSSNNAIATVGLISGTVTGVKGGSVTITATAADGGAETKATCIVTVTQPVTKIVVTPATSSIAVAKTVQLKATITPTNATNTAVTWSSSNTNIATVNSSGLVTGKAKGTVTITATAKDGSGVKGTAKVEVNMANGYEFVDLDLPSGTLWAKCNVGASTQTEIGNYYAWGETKGRGESDTTNKNNYNYSGSYIKKTYIWKTLKYYVSSTVFSKYSSDDGKKTLELSDDAANANMGGKWRMPTQTEMTELSTKCTWTWTTSNGVKGCKVVGPNGNYIFLPAGGWVRDDNVEYPTLGYYWTSTNPATYTFYAARYIYYYSNAKALGFSSNGHGDSNNPNDPGQPRFYGLNVRAVMKL